MTFQEALSKLNIEDYGDRIFHSNSHGELFHLNDYILLANTIPEGFIFRTDFEKIVKYAEDNWARPESVFQHIFKCLGA